MSAVRDLAPILSAVEIRSPMSYALRGVVHDVTGEANEGPPLLGALQRDLYAELYCGAPPTAPLPRDDVAKRDFEHQLSLANCGRGTWEPGWEVVRPDDRGRIAVAKDGLTVYAQPEEFRAEGAVAAGFKGRLKIGKEIRVAPGFYFALGDADEDPHTPGGPPIVRLYFHVTAAGAARLLGELTRVLNAAAVPFRYKTLTDPRGYVRADAAVLYLGLRHYRRVERDVAELYRSTRRQLRKRVPRFTRALAPGLGVAEDPRNGESFGQNRCRLVALGLWRAFDASARRRSDRDGSVAAVFVEAGLDPLRPHLAAGSREHYELPPP